MNEITFIRAMNGTVHPGTWKAAPGPHQAHLCCPGCGRLLELGKHTISAAGEVTPLVGCPGAGCEFSARVALSGWTANAHVPAV